MLNVLIFKNNRNQHLQIVLNNVSKMCQKHVRSDNEKTA